MDIVVVGLSGFLGALIRYYIYVIGPSFHFQNFPFGTLFINLTGCLLAGILYGATSRVSPEYKHFITLLLIGFVGSYTTFSTFSADTLHLMEANSLVKVSLNIMSNVIGGVMMVWIGRVGTELILFKLGKL